LLDCPDDGWYNRHRTRFRDQTKGPDVSSPNHQPPTSPQTARDRVAARRAARRLGLRRQLLLALGLVAALAVVALALVLLRARSALTTIQQDDPRRRPTVV